jgi:serine/threonine-protein kinase
LPHVDVVIDRPETCGAPGGSVGSFAAAVAAQDDYIGKVVAQKYRVEQMIGEGGMGKVYKATQLALDKPVVLKVLRQALLSDERTVARFQREAKAASRLNHPNSISVLDFGQSSDGALYIAMEYVQGKDLHGILSREWPLPEARVIRIVTQVLSALADAHSAGVIHRDLKPENIMVEQRRGEADFVKVLDFGIAKIVDGTNDDGPALTRAGFVCGTPEYMSPEQARGAQLDHRSDLYAVGVILYQLMAGMLPFDSDSAVGFATKHLVEQPPLPTRRRPDAKVSPAMERLIMKALSKSPDDRPQTAEQFRAELQAIEKERRAGVPTTSRRGPSAPSLPPVPRKATPSEQAATKVSGPPSPWSAQEQTVRAARASESSVTAAVTTPGVADRSTLVFKAATILLVALAIGLGGAYGWQVLHQPKEVYVPPPNAPVPVDGSNPWEYELPITARKPAEARRLADEGDDRWRQGQFDRAQESYQKAWRADPVPDLALRLGELSYQAGKLAEARAWWQRYRKDGGHQAVLPYLDQAMP